MESPFSNLIVTPKQGLEQSFAIILNFTVICWNVKKKNLWAIFSKMKYFDAYLSPEKFPRFSVSRFVAASQRGIVFESEEKNIFISCP